MAGIQARRNSRMAGVFWDLVSRAWDAGLVAPVDTSRMPGVFWDLASHFRDPGLVPGCTSRMAG